MNDSTLRQRLRAGDPAPSAQQYCDAEATRLLNEITSASTTNVVKMRKPIRRTRRIAVSAAVVAAVALSPVIKFGLQPPISAAAADILLFAADSVEPTPAFKSGQYWKITRAQWQESEGRGETTHITYTPAIGDGTKYIGIMEPKVAYEDSWWRMNPPTDGNGYWSNPNEFFIASLPRDVAGLRAQLYKDSVGHGSTLDGEAFTLAVDFLSWGNLDAEMRALVLKVLATIPRVEIETDVATSDGRIGVGISHAELVGAYDFLGNLIGEGGLRGTQVILDVNTGYIIGERDFWLGKVTFTSAQTRELVDEVPADIIEFSAPRN